MRNGAYKHRSRTGKEWNIELLNPTSTCVQNHSLLTLGPVNEVGHSSTSGWECPLSLSLSPQNQSQVITTGVQFCTNWASVGKLHFISVHMQVPHCWWWKITV